MIRFIALIFLALAMQTAAAQENDKKEVCIGFRVGSSFLDPKFDNNEANLNDIIQFLNEVRNDTTIELTQVTFCGSASPEGGSKLNHKLAHTHDVVAEKQTVGLIVLVTHLSHVLVDDAVLFCKVYDFHILYMSFVY